MFSFRHGPFCRRTGRGSVPAARFVVARATRTLPLPSLLSSHADGVRLNFRGGLHDPQLDGGGNLVYWYDAGSGSAASALEPEKPKDSTEADVQRLADEIKSFARPPTMTEARDLAVKMHGNRIGRMIYAMLKEDLRKYGLCIAHGNSLAQKLIVPLKNGG